MVARDIRTLLFSAMMVSVLNPFHSFASDKSVKSSEKELSQIVFRIGEKSISTRDLSPAERSRLYDLEMNYYKAIEGIARQRYVEFKSAPYSQLNTKEDPFAAEEKWLGHKYTPTSAEVDKTLEMLKDEKQLQGLPVGEKGKLVERYLVSQQRAKVLTEVTDKALQSGEIRMTAQEPEAPIMDIAQSVQPVIGQSKNNIRIVEFTDFQCPYCKKFSAVSGDILKKYGSRIVWEVRHFPLSFHKQARPAAAAVYCASVQGKLLEAKKWVFDAQEKLADEKIFQQMTQALKIKDAEFQKCRNSESTAKVIDSDIKEGERLGVSGTPTVFINGRRFQGDPQSLAAWDAMLNDPRIVGGSTAVQ